MKALNQIAEALVAGAGGMIFLALLMILVIDVNPALAEEHELMTYLLYSGSWLLVLPLLSLTCIVGIISDLIASVLFQPWENYRRRNAIRPPGSEAEKSVRHYYNVRNFIFSSDQTTAIAHTYLGNRVKIRLCRVWAIHASLIFGLLAFYESQSTEFNPYTFPFMLLCGLVLIGSLIGFHVATNIELRWMEPFNG
ncbi:MAG: hypothetical protein D6730_09980 [Bacteroidetes bacterium]|nr:MAG: hypothetical protein D6730_09980 [Bacteroidota bacterium]